MAVTNIVKSAVGKAASDGGFKNAFGGWYKESENVVITLDLQRSNYSALYYLNIKIYLKGAFGNSYEVTKYLIKNNIGNIFTRIPKEYVTFMNLDVDMDDHVRIMGIDNMFVNFVNPFAEQMLSFEDIVLMVNKDEVTLFPAVKQELDKLMNK